MIITRTPLRISLVGGGTDLPAFYHEQFGAVVSFAINKYVTVVLNEKFDGKTRVSYSVTENVENPEEIKHDIIRESLLHFGCSGMEVVTVSDIPGEGSGLGSSSSLAVGLNVGLRKWTNHRINIDPSFIAEDAYTLERIMAQHPVGKQDHYIAAFGGVRGFQFQPDDTVITRLIELSEVERHYLESDFMLFWTGKTRRARTILSNLQENLKENDTVISMGVLLRDLAVGLQDELLKGNIENIGHYLHEGWMLKRSMAEGVTEPWIDILYQTGLRAGASGGKLLGAGGGGFLLFAGCSGKQFQIEHALGLRHVPFKIEINGSRVLYCDGRKGE